MVVVAMYEMNSSFVSYVFSVSELASGKVPSGTGIKVDLLTSLTSLMSLIQSSSVQKLVMLLVETRYDLGRVIRSL